MLDGKKSVAQKIVYDAFDIIKEKEGKNPLEVFEAALENVMPVLEVKARRVGGATYQVPLEIRPERRQTLGLRWIVTYARNRHEKTMAEKLAGELIDANTLQTTVENKTVYSVVCCCCRLETTGLLLCFFDSCLYPFYFLTLRQLQHLA